MNTPPPPTLGPASGAADAVLVELRGLRSDFQGLSTRFDATDKRSLDAYNIANSALRAVTELGEEWRANQAAMVRHVETITSASRAVVEANDRQTPILQAIQAAVAQAPSTLRRYSPMVVAIAALLGMLWREAIFAVHAFQASAAAPSPPQTVIVAPAPQAPAR